MITPRSEPGVAAYAQELFVAGGYSAGRRVDIVEIYDPTAEKWRKVYCKPPGHCCVQFLINSENHVVFVEGFVSPVVHRRCPTFYPTNELHFLSQEYPQEYFMM